MYPSESAISVCAHLSRAPTEGSPVDPLKNSEGHKTSGHTGACQAAEQAALPLVRKHVDALEPEH